MPEVICYGFGHASTADLLVARGEKGFGAIIIREPANKSEMAAELARRFRDADLAWSIRPRGGSRQRCCAIPRATGSCRGGWKLGSASQRSLGRPNQPLD